MNFGRIRGIPIRVHWSLIPVFAMIADGLATGLLPSLVPNAGWLAYWIAAVVGTALFYLALLTHELSHAVIARSRGVQVDSITIWLFGGVARLKGDAPSPSAEAMIALVGPAVSVGIAIAFALIAIALNAISASMSLPAALAEWLATINLVVALFNLVPAFPLDGGRALQAFLWHRSGNMTRATMTAARGGKLFGYFLIGAGVLDVVLGGDLSGIWLGLVGLFLLGAAGSEEGRTELRDRLGDLLVGEVMSPDPIVAPDWITVSELIRSYVLIHRVSAFPVQNLEGRLTGLVTLRQIAKTPEAARVTTPIGGLIIPLSDIPMATPSDRLVDLLERMDGRAGGRALVFVGDKLVGIVSPSDVTLAVTRNQLRRGQTAVERLSALEDIARVKAAV